MDFEDELDICPYCNQPIPWDEGCDDDMPEACDTCWAEQRKYPHCDLNDSPKIKAMFKNFFASRLKKTDSNSGIEL
jgi:hypothetical protein